MNLEENLNKILSKYDELQKKVTSDEVINSSKDYAIISKEISEILPIVELIKKFKKVRQEIKDSNAIIEDTKNDNEMKEMAKSELENLVSTEKKLEKEIQIAVLPKDKDDSKNAVLEIRAGTGGDEAGLFAADLFRMYQRYCDLKSWKFEILSVNESLSGSYKEAMALVSGDNVFSKLKFESGVHRVQRVPDTEASGRIHTSAATVAVLPEVEDVDVQQRSIGHRLQRLNQAHQHIESNVIGPQADGQNPGTAQVHAGEQRGNEHQQEIVEPTVPADQHHTKRGVHQHFDANQHHRQIVAPLAKGAVGVGVHADTDDVDPGQNR